MRAWLCPLALFMSAIVGLTGSANPSAAPEAGKLPPVIVIGFVGGFVSHEDLVHSEVQLAANLRRDYSSGVYAEAFENYHRSKAHQEILRLLDTDDSGTLTVEEKRNARIIIYGHSWGASEGIRLARQLARDRIPVLLTIQVDSISKIGQNDAVIPANVAQAVNFYQATGWVRGRPKIRAADATHTEIIGNLRFDYYTNPLRCAAYPWWDRVLVKAHTEIECDPRVWDQVEALIRTKLPPAARSEQREVLIP
jgi:hypothetical protein